MILFQDIPKNLSVDEERLLFRHLQVRQFQAYIIRAQPVAVVGRVLSSSDLLLKLRWETGAIVYSHYRLGTRKHCPMPSWHPIGGPYPDLDTAVNKATLEKLAEDSMGITPVNHGIPDA